jgi:hypothetical protein
MPARVRLPTVGAVGRLSIFGESISRYPCWLALAGISLLTGVSLSSPQIMGFPLGNVASMTAPSNMKPPLSSVKGVTTSPSGIPLMGLAEAASACGVSVSTLRRKRTQLKELGAAETARGWQIPVTALITLGLMDRVTEAPSRDTHPDALTGELDSLRSQLAAAEQRAAVAEAIAAERERVIQTQAMALRMLEAAVPTPSTADGIVNNQAHLDNVSPEGTLSSTSPAEPTEQQKKLSSRWASLHRFLGR